MKPTLRIGLCLTVIAASGFLSWNAPPAHAYIEAAMSFGAVVAQSTNIVLMHVESVDRERNLIVYRKVQDIKGKHPTEVIKHNIGRGGLRPNEWKPPIDWAEPGKLAVFFYQGGASETCIGNWWYQAYAGGEWWNHSHGEPFLLRTYCGPPERLVTIVGDIMAGKDVIVTCMVDGPKEDLHNRRGKIQRMKVSLKLQDYNSKRDFVGWGGDDFRRVAGLPGFTHYAGLMRVDPDAQAIASVDYDGDGKPDLCLVGAGRVVLVQNGGDSLNEMPLPFSGGCRSAVWADYNGDGKPDLLLATPAGPKLFTNLGTGFRDDTHLLPEEPYYNLTAAAWIDYDGDGRPDILLANGYHGLRLYRNLGRTLAKAVPPKFFADVSADVGFGPNGAYAGMKGDTLTVADVNGDGRSDFLYGAGKGLLFLNTKEDSRVRFTQAKDSGIAFTPGKVGPVFADFDNDGVLDLFVPQKNGCKLFNGMQGGRFVDVTAKAGDLAALTGWATSAAWGDFDNDGHIDLVVGCLRGTNRFFRNKGDGTFEDCTDKVGLHHKIFNTQAVCLVDLNGDGVLDMVFNNEGQESAVLLGNPEQGGKRTPLTVTVAGKGVIGSRVQVVDKQGKTMAMQEISGGDGRGGQHAPQTRFALDPGAYRVLVRYSSGITRAREITVASAPVRSRVDEDVEE